MNKNLKRVATLGFTLAGIAGVTTMTSSPATAMECMVDCWTEGGGWGGGGGLGGNPNTGSGGGGSDGGRVGNGGYEGPNLDRYAPSGNGWNDSRLPKPQPAPQEDEPAPPKGPGDAEPGTTGASGSEEVATVMTTNLDLIDPGRLDLTAAIEALKRAQADRDREFNDPESTEVSREFAQELVDQAEEAVNRAMNAQYQQVCAAKPYLPQC